MPAGMRRCHANCESVIGQAADNEPRLDEKHLELYLLPSTRYFGHFRRRRALLCLSRLSTLRAFAAAARALHRSRQQLGLHRDCQQRRQRVDVDEHGAELLAHLPLGPASQRSLRRSAHSLKKRRALLS
eukprot:280292-Pleurochrysis_carterae.AAC.3